jgi:CubicO group peptidase (beta-lactamase class C family)
MTLQDAVEAARREHPVPGAVVGVVRAGRLSLAASGTANVVTTEPMTVDTAFLTGSITKTWAAALTMLLVEQGALGLDDPVVKHGLVFGDDPRVREAITVRQLLDHSSGVDSGDLLLDTGGYPEGVDAYLALLREVGHLHEPGRYASYNNAGWLVLEGVLRRVTGRTFQELLTDRVIRPVGATRTVLSPEEAILHRTAVGHFPDVRGGFTRTRRFLMPECLSAAGTTLVTTAEDTLRYLSTLLDRGGLLTPRSVEGLLTPSSYEPAGAGSGFALGWRFQDLPSGRTFWHGGGSNGGYAIAAVVPDEDLAYVAFANSSHSAPFHAALAGAVLGDRSPLTGDPVVPTSGDADASAVVGRFSRQSTRITVEPVDSATVSVELETVEEEWTGAGLYREGMPHRFTAVLTGPDRAVSTVPVLAGAPATLTFHEPDEAGRYRLVWFERRLAARVE